MQRSFEQRAILGVLIWIGILASVTLVGRQLAHESPAAFREIGDYLTRQRRQIRLQSDYNLYVELGDPVYLAGSDRVSPIGMISQIEFAADGVYASEMTVSMYGSSPAITDRDHFEFHFAPDSTDWLIRTMLHDEKRDEIKKLIERAFEEHRDEIVIAFRPVMEAALLDATSLIGDDLRLALERHNLQLKRIGDRYQGTLVKEELVPLFENVIWPMVIEEGQPLAEQIAMEVWNEVSLISFGWRYLYDRSPLPEKNLTEKRFKRFVDEKAKPILESHMGDLVALQQRLATRIANDEQVKSTVSSSLRVIATDPEIQKLLVDVFKEVVIDNTRLHDTIQRHWESEEAKRALSTVNSRLDPVIRDIGVSLFGTPRDGITPEFAKVLRRRILHKDDKWLTLHLSDSGQNADADRNAPFPTSLPVRLSNDDTTIPYVPSRREQ